MRRVSARPRCLSLLTQTPTPNAILTCSEVFPQCCPRDFLLPRDFLGSHLPALPPPSPRAWRGPWEQKVSPEKYGHCCIMTLFMG